MDGLHSAVHTGIYRGALAVLDHLPDYLEGNAQRQMDGSGGAIAHGVRIGTVLCDPHGLHDVWDGMKKKTGGKHRLSGFLPVLFAGLILRRTASA